MAIAFLTILLHLYKVLLHLADSSQCPNTIAPISCHSTWNALTPLRAMKQKPIKYYQLFPLVHPDIVLRQIAKSHAFGACILFDLEDSVMDPVDPETTRELKSNARKNLIELGKMVNAGGLSPAAFHIRVNPLHSPELQLDLAALRAANIPWTGIFVPQVEQPEHIELYSTKLETSGIQFKELIPILETRAGLANTEAIFENRPTTVKAAFFGNYDYHLEMNQFPVADQSEPAYWEIVEPLIANLERLGVQFGNSPYTHLKDDPAFLQILERLSWVCKLPLRQVTLRLQQTKLCHSFGKSVENMMALQLLNAAPEVMPLDEAKTIVLSFERQRSRQRTTQTSQAKRFITPQEYLLARERLRDSVVTE